MLLNLSLKKWQRVKGIIVKCLKNFFKEKDTFIMFKRSCFFHNIFLERLKHFLAPKLLVTIRRSSHLSFDFTVKFVESKKKICLNQKKTDSINHASWSELSNTTDRQSGQKIQIANIKNRFNEIKWSIW